MFKACANSTCYYNFTHQKDFVVTASTTASVGVVLAYATVILYKHILPTHYQDKEWSCVSRWDTSSDEASAFLCRTPAISSRPKKAAGLSVC